MPRLRKKGTNGYYYACFYDSKRTPKEKNVPLKTNRKHIADRKYTRLLDEYELDRYDPWAVSGAPRSLSVRSAANDFLASRSHLRPKSLEAYSLALRGVISKLPPGIRLIDVLASHIRSYVHNVNVSQSTRRHRYAHLRTFFNWCLKTGLLETSPLAEVPVPKDRKRVAEFLTPSQLERLFRAIDADYEMKRKSRQARKGEILWIKDLILVAVSTGLRRSELCNLLWSHVDFESGFINVRNERDFITKSGNERSIPMVGDALSVLTRMRDTGAGQTDGYMFRGVNGGKLDGSFASKAFKRYVRLAMLPENIRFHSLRHTCASWLVQRGVALPIVQAILGHSSIQVTQRYAHLAPDVLQSAMRSALGSGIAELLPTS